MESYVKTMGRAAVPSVTFNIFYEEELVVLTDEVAQQGMLGSYRSFQV